MAESPEIVSAPPKKRLAIFLDGTWNTVGDNTNVWRLKSLCAPKSADNTTQLVYYDIGVNRFLGGTFGKGLSQNLREAYEWLVENYNVGDEIFIFGFSRGAFTARSLAGFIAKCGLLKPGSALGVGQLYERYRRPEDRTIWQLCAARDENKLGVCSLEEQWMLKYAIPAPIKLVGVWDSVGSLGIPFLSIPGISRSTLGFLHTGLRISIENGFHALAIDEHRRDFTPTLWTTRAPKDPKAVVAAPRPLSSVEQRWFVGAHGNVGGGYASDLLAQVPLRWIMKKASLHGLSFRNDVDLDGDVLDAPVSDSYREFLHGLYCKVYGRSYRTIGERPVVREDGTHRSVNETIDASVFERWRSDGQYRPKSMEAWSKLYKVDPASFGTSIRANSPDEVAPD
jgi:uncharacterized protein (DUF2235 family)